MAGGKPNPALQESRKKKWAVSGRIFNRSSPNGQPGTKHGSRRESRRSPKRNELPACPGKFAQPGSECTNSQSLHSCLLVLLADVKGVLNPRIEARHMVLLHGGARYRGCARVERIPQYHLQRAACRQNPRLGRHVSHCNDDLIGECSLSWICVTAHGHEGRDANRGH